MAELTHFTPESLPRTEQTPEHHEEAVTQTANLERSLDTQPHTPPATRPAKQKALRPQTSDPIQQEVEFVLSENIGDIFKQLPAQQKLQFKKTGEEIAMRITAMIKSGMIQIKKILELIRGWLTIIPGVNKFFLEQEAKIKTDKIQEIYTREHARTI